MLELIPTQAVEHEQKVWPAGSERCRKGVACGSTEQRWHEVGDATLAIGGQYKLVRSD